MNPFPTQSGPVALVIILMASVFVAPMALDSVLGFPLLGMIIARFVNGQGFSPGTQRTLWSASVLLLLYLFASLTWSPVWDWQDVVQIGLRATLCFCFLLVLSDIQGKEANFLQCLSRAVAVALLIAIPLCIAWWIYAPPYDGRMEGLFRLNNSGKLGRTIAAALPLLLIGIVNERNHWRAVHLATFLLCLAALNFTDTRAAWLGAIMAIATLFTAHRQTRPLRFVGTFTCVSMALLALLSFVAFHPDPEVTRLLLPRNDSFRLLIWQEHLASFLANSIWFGQGFLAEMIVHSAEATHKGAHNMFLSVAFQSGLVGLALYIIVIAGTATRLIQHLERPLSRVALSMLFAGLVMFVFDGDRLIDKVNMVWYVVWFPIAVALLPAQKQAAT